MRAVMGDATREGSAWGLADVSRETLERLEAFEALVRKWTAAINLIAPGTVDDIRRRHTLDSAQLFALAPDHAGSWVDLGAGGGFPGMVIAILAEGSGRQLDFRLVESDARKCAFLEAATRELGVRARVLRRRVEGSPFSPADVVSARALAPLGKLLTLAAPWRNSGGVFLFPKGARVDAELTEARRCWHMDVDRIASATDPQACVLRIRECLRVG
ncbi:MAG: 16S rRNA (guanine(527)-N(7))-methyltransferase RsmG [Rubrimonas sp.]|uniref:16S rRNA (guanine(527)-N(7))-methyltransferase RsmG n=1 Tax=Rubrimonas sp. TaxID=2036015 RepID=UPI002FDDA467